MLLFLKFTLQKNMKRRNVIIKCWFTFQRNVQRRCSTETQRRVLQHRERFSSRLRFFSDDSDNLCLGGRKIRLTQIQNLRYYKILYINNKRGQDKVLKKMKRNDATKRVQDGSKTLNVRKYESQRICNKNQKISWKHSHVNSTHAQASKEWLF